MKVLIKNIAPVILLFILSSFNLQHQEYILKIRVNGIKDIKGNMEIAIYNKKENFLQKGFEYITYSIPITNDYLVTEFRLPKGIYAIALYHDTNSNGICDRNFFGIPKEGFGFSNNYKPKFGDPSFNNCKFPLGSDKNININLLFY